MKKLLPFAGFCATVLGIVALILIMATKSVGYINGNISYWYSGLIGLFGGTQDNASYAGTPGAIIAFVLLIVGIIAACAASLLPLLKKFVNLAGWFGLVGCACLIIAGILIFCEVPMFNGAVQPILEGNKLGGGWVVAGILAIVGGAVALLPSLFAFLAKKK
ncbi:MAG: hypothetical protein BWY98_00121 [Tenericutes bacterium ADurb.BinA155]|nr:MAG: hypothetical protein BWY98_00121 [Tenericutes bacterium ADurb.BinA155]